MRGPGEHVHGQGLLGAVALGGQAGEVPGQGGRVAGDVDDPRGGHLDHGVDDRRGQTLSGRVHTDDIRPQALSGKALGGVGGVAAEKLCVGDAVAPGVVPGVLHSGGDDLSPHHPAGLPGHHQGDGADAAVEVQHGLPAGEAGKLHRLLVEDLALVPVHLVEGGH